MRADSRGREGHDAGIDPLMSSFFRRTKHPITGKFEPAWWLDNYFGRFRYGVKVPDGQVFRQEGHKWEFDDDTPLVRATDREQRR